MKRGVFFALAGMVFVGLLLVGCGGESKVTAPPTLTPGPTRPPVALTGFQLELEHVVGGLDEPVALANAGDGSRRLYVVERKGLIWVIQDGKLLPTPFLDLTDRVNAVRGEQGLLGLAFDPDYANNGYFFVNYINVRGDTLVNRFMVSAEDPNQGDPNSETVVLVVDQPAANHNGGHLAFGPDGYLYVGTGDGGGDGDPRSNGQNGGNLLGAMLRLDVSNVLYAVPYSNPFVGTNTARLEIWALGLRNPWRYSFDPLTGDLYIADVGQDGYEEINVQPAYSLGGENYGWSVMEGWHCYPEERACDPEMWTLPVVEYDHSLGCAVVGGYVYRGESFPRLEGVYFFGDYCSGRIWGLGPDGAGGWQWAELAQTDLAISSFGEDDVGELYLVDARGGDLYRIVAH